MSKPLIKRLIEGDSRLILPTLAANSLDACVCDPPYHLQSVTARLGKEGAAPIQFGTDGAFRRASTGFMGKSWDGGDIAFDKRFWKKVFRVLKPGGHLLAFGGTRTDHRVACAIEDAGFEIRDKILYCYATGFPKSHNVSKGIDSLLGNERVVVGDNPNRKGRKPEGYHEGWSRPWQADDDAPAMKRTAAGSPESAAWDGWGTALKPAVEPIIVARKPIQEASVARNVLKYGTGAININACRIHTAGSEAKSYTIKRLKPGATLNETGGNWRPEDGVDYEGESAAGRWPANLILSCQCDGPHEADCPVAMLDAQSGVLQSGFLPAGTEREGVGYHGGLGCTVTNDSYGDSGGASRFFFIAKPTRREKGERNTHPTVKPIALMKHLVSLVCPPGGIVLDPFLGSGTTAVACERLGFGYVAIEREAEYMVIARQRVRHAVDYREDDAAINNGQPSLFAEDL